LHCSCRDIRDARFTAKEEEMMENQSLKPIYYLAIGDSLTAGFAGVSSAHTFVAHFFEHLRRTEHCQVRNWGISGMTSGELLDFIRHPAVSRSLTELTHLTITIGGCDFIHMYEAGPITVGRLFHTFRTMQHHVKQILQIVRWNNREAIVCLLGFYIPVPLYPMGVEKVSLFIQSMNYYYEQLCNRYQAKLINPFANFLHRFDYFYDEVHPNHIGHHQLANIFITAVAPHPTPVNDT
jgi:lysophospholipase L1-like esterase